jgi:hypothetical protein
MPGAVLYWLLVCVATIGLMRPVLAEEVTTPAARGVGEWKLTISSRGECFLEKRDPETGELYQGVIVFADIPKVEQALKKLKKCVRQ